VGRSADKFESEAVQMLTWDVASGERRHFPSQPVWAKHAYDAVPNFEFAYSISHLDCISSAVGERHAPVGKRHFALHYKMVPQVYGSSLILTRTSPGLGEGQFSSQNREFSKPPEALNLANRIFTTVIY
jgi:hypothetical protein